MQHREQTLVPQLSVDGGVAALDFYLRAFGAKELYRLQEGGKIAHAEFELQGSVIMLADEYPDFQCVSPKRHQGHSCWLAIYVPDVDAFVKRAVDAGAEVERPIKDEFYGDRVATLRDPFGHRWSIHTRREVLTNDEIKRRYETMTSGV